MSMIPHNTLVVVADGRSARLFRNQGDESGLKLQQTTEMDAETSGSQPRDNQVGEAVFARALTERINGAALRNSFEHLVLAADPATLGEMRRHLHKEAAARLLAEVAKDWTNTPLEQIEKALHELRVG